MDCRLLILALLTVVRATSASGAEPAAASDGGPAPVEIEGVVRGSDGEPVPEARLVLSTAAKVALESTDTDQAGRFRLPEIPPGSYQLEVTADGFAPLRKPLEVAEELHGLVLVLVPEGASGFKTVIQSQRAPLPAQDATTTTNLTQNDIQQLPGGTTRQLNDVVDTGQGVTPDNYGALHIRGNFAGLQLRIDGIQLPTAIQDRLQQLVPTQIVDQARVIVGGLPAEFGEDVAGVIDVTTRRPQGEPGGETDLLYGTYNHAEVIGHVAGAVGPFNAAIAGSLETTDRGLDPPAEAPILNDTLHDGRLFLRMEDTPSSRDRLELLGIYAESHYEVPVDPTLLPLSDGPANALRGQDQYGNSAPPFLPYNSTPRELERELFAGLSWFHDFSPSAQLQIAPIFRYDQSALTCDAIDELGPTVDPGATCSSVNHQVFEGGLQANQTFAVGINHFRAGLLLDYQHSDITYDQYFQGSDGFDPGMTLGGEDDIDTVLGGVYVQDEIKVGKWTFLPGFRLDYQHSQLAASALAPGASSDFWGPSLRLGVAYAFTERMVLHAFVGDLFQAPSYDAPVAARILGLIPATSPIPFNLQPETDYYAEIGFADRVIPQWTWSLTGWGRLSQNTLDDNEVGDSALTADYNYVRGRAAGLELASSVVAGKNVRGFANVSTEVAQGEGIETSQYLFTAQQLAFTGYQEVDNAQLLTANVGIDVSDNPGRTHLSGLMRFGSGLRTGPTQTSTLPPNTEFDFTLRHQFDVALHPEVALDVLNAFNEVYTYRIATGDLAGTDYAPLREILLRVILHFGS
jgi:outer membrane cobalamin receptor